MTSKDPLYEQCLNFDDMVNLDTPIYRTMSIERFIELLNSKKLTLLKPKKWDDPYENTFLLSDFKIGASGEIGSFSSGDSIYGLCWTLQEESDAMWRIYSGDKRGVTVKTTPRKLLNSLNDSIGRSAQVTCFIGRVEYLEIKEIEAEYQKLQEEVTSTDGTGLAKSLLYKRHAFEHEKEVRLLYNAPDDKCQSDLYQFQIDPNSLFDQIMFDPRLDQSIYEIYKDGVKKYGFTKGVIKSELYDMPAKKTYTII